MANKIGNLIKKSRTEAGLTQEELAKKVKGLSASDIGKTERGEKELTQEELKLIAKALGVTQKSLLEAAASSRYTTTSSSSKTSDSKKTETSGTSMKLTAAEKKLVELYREADAATKKQAVALLKGEETGILEMLTNGKDLSSLIKSADGKNLLSSLLKKM